MGYPNPPTSNSVMSKIFVSIFARHLSVTLYIGSLINGVMPLVLIPALNNGPLTPHGLTDYLAEPE